MVLQARMVVLSGGRVQVSILTDEINPQTKLRRVVNGTFETWGAALAAVNMATAWNGAPDPTNPPAGTPEVETEGKAA